MMKRLAVCLMIVFFLGGVLYASAEENAEKEKDSSKTGKESEEGLKKSDEQKLKFGSASEADYTAKHFTLIQGAVILNQFKAQKHFSDSDPGTLDRITLDDGNTDAQAFIEGGYRYRWAWLDRTAVSPKKRKQVSEARSELNQAELARLAETDPGKDDEREAAVKSAKAALKQAEKEEGQLERFAEKKRRNQARKVEIQTLLESVEKIRKGLKSGKLDPSAMDEFDKSSEEVVASLEKLKQRVKEAKEDVTEAEGCLKQAKNERWEAQKKLQDAKSKADTKDAELDSLRKTMEGKEEALQQSVERFQDCLDLAPTDSESRAVKKALELAQDCKRWIGKVATVVDQGNNSASGASGNGETADPKKPVLSEGETLMSGLKSALQQAEEEDSALVANAPEVWRLQTIYDSWKKEKGHFVYMVRWNWTGSLRSGKGWLALLTPENWTVRLGYAFAGSSGTGTKEIVNASDLYAQVGFGKDLIRWSFLASDPKDVPIRCAIGPEVLTHWYTDKANLDIHYRTLAGFSASFGIPIRFTSSEENEAPAIVELVVRLGAVYAEYPKFSDDTTREIGIKNGGAKYADEWGAGLDVEFNVPISKKLGYAVFRGAMNADYDPNPWSISAGYTIPLGSLASGLGLQKKEG